MYCVVHETDNTDYLHFRYEYNIGTTPLIIMQ